MKTDETIEQVDVAVSVGSTTLHGTLAIPGKPKGIVLFAHGTGSSRFSPRNQYVAARLNESAFVTLLMDLLTADEETIDAATRHLRFDIPLLAGRLAGAIDWIVGHAQTERLPIGLFGASTGAAAALVAAAQRPEQVKAVVSRGGRPDLAADALPKVAAPTLLIVGSLDRQVWDLNEAASRSLPGEKQLVVVPGASHLFEEPGKLQEVARLAGLWFAEHLRPCSLRRFDGPCRHDDAPRSPTLATVHGRLSPRSAKRFFSACMRNITIENMERHPARRWSCTTRHGNGDQQKPSPSFEYRTCPVFFPNHPRSRLRKERHR